METNQIKWIAAGVVGVILLMLFIALIPFTIVDAGERAVILRVGKVNRVLDSGIHWVTPFIEDVESFDVRTLKEEIKAASASKDLQTVSTVVALNYNLMPDKVGVLYQEVGRNYKEVVIDPAILEAVKAATAKYTAEELITKRELVREDMKTALSVRLAREYINVTEVSIVDFDFSAQFNSAIESKVTAEQNALAAKNKLEQVKFEAQQQIETAKAEAETTRLQAEALKTSTQFIEFKRLEVQLEVAKKWDGRLPQNYYAGAPLPLLDITSVAK